MKNIRGLQALSLLASSSTLVCCALPSLLIALGMGSVMLGLAQHVPGLIWLSENKVWSFAVSAVLLSMAGLWQWRYRHVCPTDPELARACAWSKKWGLRLYWVSLALFLVGFVFAYVLPNLLSAS